MIHKFQLTAEALFITLAINWQPLAALVLGIPGAWYYIAMLKQNVVDKKHEGSWKSYFKSIFKF